MLQQSAQSAFEKGERFLAVDAASSEPGSPKHRVDADLEVDGPPAPKGWAGGLSDLGGGRGERLPGAQRPARFSGVLVRGKGGDLPRPSDPQPAFSSAMRSVRVQSARLSALP